MVTSNFYRLVIVVDFKFTEHEKKKRFLQFFLFQFQFNTPENQLKRVVEDVYNSLLAPQILFPQKWLSHGQIPTSSPNGSEFK